MALIGYARISTAEQNLDPQVDALKSAGCETVFEDVISDAKAERPGLNEALAFLRNGDTLVVWKLDRLGRSMKHLVETVTGLGERGVGVAVEREELVVREVRVGHEDHVHRLLAHLYLVVKVRTGAASRRAHARDHFAALHLLSGLDQDLR